ncbi:MAG: hypothetical protein OHK0056_17820 [Bacteriovoracaceae bacterium]
MNKVFDSKRNQILALIGIGFLLFLPLNHILIGLRYNCFHLIDYGIYQQAIYQIADGVSWNPYVTVRDIFIFNEHFDPVIYLAAPFVRLFNYSYWSLAVFEWLWYVGFCLLALKWAKIQSIKEWILAAGFIFFARGLLSAVLFSGHPSTWAIVPIILLVYFIYKDHTWGIILSALSLNFFKETFPFAVFGLAIPFLLSKDFKRGLPIFIIGCFFVAFELKLRSMWLGKTFAYGNSYLGEIAADPVGRTLKLFKEFEYDSFFKIFFPYFIPLFYLFRREKYHWDFFKTPLAKVSFFLIPMMLIHFIINRYYFHHASQFSAAIIGMILFSGVLTELVKSKKIFWISLVLILVNGMSMYTRLVKSSVGNKVGRCVIYKEKIPYAEKIREIVDTIAEDKIIYTTGGIGPRIMRPRLSLYHHEMCKKMDRYDYLILELKQTDSIWPMHPDTVQGIYKNCREFADEILMENDFFFFAKGKFPHKCIFGF